MAHELYPCSPVIEGQYHTKFQQNYFKRFFSLFEFVSMCTCLSKKFTENFAGESTEKAIYKMAAITECEILYSVHTVFPACHNQVIGIHTSVFCIKELNWIYTECIYQCIIL